jgi:hypothetical protein
MLQGWLAAAALPVSKPPPAPGAPLPLAARSGCQRRWLLSALQWWSHCTTKACIACQAQAKVLSFSRMVCRSWGAAMPGSCSTAVDSGAHLCAIAPAAAQLGRFLARQAFACGAGEVVRRRLERQAWALQGGGEHKCEFGVHKTRLIRIAMMYVHYHEAYNCSCCW